VIGFAISDELAAFLMQGNSIVVATRSAALEPHAVRACGLRVLAKNRIAVLLPRATSSQTLQNLEDNADIAVCACSPVDYRTVQLKGRFLEVGQSSAEDLLLSEQQLRGFGTAAAQFGFSRAQARNLWLFDCWCVELRVTAGYTQTPGRGAGAPLEVVDGERSS
jgi:hypothetical protein